MYLSGEHCGQPPCRDWSAALLCASGMPVSNKKHCVASQHTVWLAG